MRVKVLVHLQHHLVKPCTLLCYSFSLRLGTEHCVQLLDTASKLPSLHIFILYAGRRHDAKYTTDNRSSGWNSVPWLGMPWACAPNSLPVLGMPEHDPNAVGRRRLTPQAGTSAYHRRALFVYYMLLSSQLSPWIVDVTRI